MAAAVPRRTTTPSPDVLPTFLGIGAPKAGTTWIHDLLGGHPDVLVPDRKELHYFDRSFDKGPGWYEGFFTPPADRPNPHAAGEFTTGYLYDPAVPSRVRSVPSIERLVLSVRHPIDRAVSHYRFRQQVDNYQGSFDDFLTDHPHATDWGRYATHLRPWLDEFDRAQLLVLVHEQTIADPAAASTALAAFLGIDPAAFPGDAGATPVNPSFAPRHRRLYAAATSQAQRLRRRDMDWAIALADRVGMKRWLRRAGRQLPKPDISPATSDRLWRELEPEVDALEAMCGLDLSVWRRA